MRVSISYYVCCCRNLWEHFSSVTILCIFFTPFLLAVFHSIHFVFLLWFWHFGGFCRSVFYTWFPLCVSFSTLVCSLAVNACLHFSIYFYVFPDFHLWFLSGHVWHAFAPLLRVFFPQFRACWIIPSYYVLIWYRCHFGCWFSPMLHVLFPSTFIFWLDSPLAGSFGIRFGFVWLLLTLFVIYAHLIRILSSFTVILSSSYHFIWALFELYHMIITR